MAVSINWITNVIFIPKADMPLIQASPEIRSLDLNSFHLELKDLEDSEEGMSFPSTHTHNTEVSLSGIVYARIIVINAPYTVEFEDDQYAVSCTGANHNLADVKVANQVSLLINNAAGLISNAAIEHSSFQNKVTIDVINGFSGTTYPIGTPFMPVNNLTDAKQIGTNRGLVTMELLSDLTVTTGESIDDLVIVSRNWIPITLDAGSTCVNAVFTKVSVSGVMSGLWNVMDDCWVYTITNFCGWMRNGTAFVDVTLAPYSIANEGASFFDNCLPMIPGDISVLTMNTDVKVSFTNAHDLFQVNGMTTGSVLNFGMLKAKLTIDASCIGGDITIGGVGITVNNSAVMVNDTGLLNQAVIADETWKEIIEGSYTAEEMLKLVASVAAGKSTILDLGGGLATVTFRDINDTTDRVIANMTNSERTIVTKNL